MQNFFIVVVVEGDMVQHDIVARKGDGGRAVLLLLGVQNLIHLAHGGAHLCQCIHKVEGRHDGGCHAQCQNDDREEGFGRQAAVEIQQPAHGQDGEHLCREEAVGHGHAQLALFHPVDVILGVVSHLIGELCVGLTALIEGLDDLDAVDVLDESGAHFGGRLHGTGIVLAVAAHDGHHEEERHREHHQTEQRQPPVQHEQVQDGEHRGRDVGGHFREQMGQRGLHRGILGTVVRDGQQKHQRHCRCRQRNDRRAGTEHQQAEEHHRKVQVAAHKVVDHADAHAFQRAKAGGERVEDVAGAHLLEVAQRHPLEGVAHGKAVPGHQLIADGFLKAGAQVIKQKAQEHQHQQ